MPLLHPAANNSVVCSETPIEVRCLLKPSRQLDERIFEGVADWRGPSRGSCVEGGLGNPPTVPAGLETRVESSNMGLLAAPYVHLSVLIF